MSVIGKVLAIAQPVVTAAIAVVTPPSKQTSPRRADRPTRIDEQGRRIVEWPDDDLAELEHPERAGGWLDRRRTRDWLRRRRR